MIRGGRRTSVTVGAAPAAMTAFTTGVVAVVVTKPIVARSTELGAARAVEVVVADGAVAVHDDRQQR